MKRNRFLKSHFLSLVLLIQLMVSPCFGEKLSVVASIFPVADMVEQVGGNHVQVTTMIPAGASPHTFEPKPGQVKKFSEADIFFYIGAGLESWAGKFSNTSKKPHLVIELSHGMNLIRSAHHRDHSDSHMTGSHEKHENHNSAHPEDAHKMSGFANPHIWLDPVYAKTMVAKIVDALSSIDKSNHSIYEQRGRDYQAEIERLHTDILESVSAFKLKEFVAFHPSWDYFARRYGLECVGIIEEAPGRNPTPKHIKKIISSIKQYNIKAVFAEPQLNPRVAEIVAREAHVKVLFLDPMGGPKVKKRNTYIDLMNYNLNVLKEAML